MNTCSDCERDLDTEHCDECGECYCDGYETGVCQESEEYGQDDEDITDNQETES